MSGFEVAGIILGALPLIVSALEGYRMLAEKAGFWRDIRREYQKFETRLQCQRLDFITTLRVLLLPLVTEGDSARINYLISDPTGAVWKDPQVEKLLREKLQDQYELYEKVVDQIKQVVLDLEKELLVDSAAVQEGINQSTPTGIQKARKVWDKVFPRRTAEKEGSLSMAMSKWKFINGEQPRTKLLNDFERFNKDLKTILRASDKETEIAAVASKSAIDDAMCSFYLNAAKLFKLLLASWKCACPGHSAKLQLQHRTTRAESEFRLLFATSKNSYWELCYIRISHGTETTIAKTSQSTTTDCEPKFQPGHQTTTPLKSAVRVRAGATQPKQVGFLSPPVPEIIVTPDEATEAPHIQAIHCLCTSLSECRDPCCGYLGGEDHRYYVYPASHDKIDTFAPLTLADLLTSKKRLRRLQRLALSLTLTSSFLQLFDSPWLPESLGKSDIQFVVDPDDQGVFKLDQPHIESNFRSPIRGQRQAKIKESLPRLGIVLLELCFGEPLETQSCREELGEFADAKMSAAMDLAAAITWFGEVRDEAGPDYAEAIGWCLTGIKMMQTDTQEWRKQMLLKVVRPLEKCYRDLEGNL